MKASPWWPLLNWLEKVDISDRAFWRDVARDERQHHAGDEPWQCVLCGAIQWSRSCPGLCLNCGAFMQDWYAPEDLEEGLL